MNDGSESPNDDRLLLYFMDVDEPSEHTGGGSEPKSDDADGAVQAESDTVAASNSKFSASKGLSSGSVGAAIDQSLNASGLGNTCATGDSKSNVNYACEKRFDDNGNQIVNSVSIKGKVNEITTFDVVDTHHRLIRDGREKWNEIKESNLDQAKTAAKKDKVQQKLVVEKACQEYVHHVKESECFGWNKKLRDPVFWIGSNRAAGIPWDTTRILGQVVGKSTDYALATEQELFNKIIIWRKDIAKRKTKNAIHSGGRRLPSSRPPCNRQSATIAGQQHQDLNINHDRMVTAGASLRDVSTSTTSAKKSTIAITAASVAAASSVSSTAATAAMTAAAVSGAIDTTSTVATPVTTLVPAAAAQTASGGAAVTLGSETTALRAAALPATLCDLKGSSEGRTCSLPRKRQKGYGWTPLYYSGKELATTKLLFESGAHLHYKDNDGSTALHTVCNHNGTLEVVKVLLEHGIDRHAKNNFGKTAFEMTNDEKILGLKQWPQAEIGTDNKAKEIIKASLDGDLEKISELTQWPKAEVERLKNEVNKLKEKLANSEQRRLKEEGLRQEAQEQVEKLTTFKRGAEEELQKLKAELERSRQQAEEEVANMKQELETLKNEVDRLENELAGEKHRRLEEKSLEPPLKMKEGEQLKITEEMEQAEEQAAKGEELIFDCRPASNERGELSSSGGRDADITGLSLLEDVEKIYNLLKDGQDDNAQQLLEQCQQQQQNYPQPNIFNLIPPNDIRDLLMSADQEFYETIKKSAIKLIDLVGTNFNKPEEVSFRNSQNNNCPIATKPPLVMDHTIRETAANTPYGHTAYMKYLSWKLVKSIGCKSIALSGLFYGDMYTVEEQFLQLLYKLEGDDGMKGGFVMCGPDKEDRKKAMEMIKATKVPNLFLDVTLPLVRFDAKSIPDVGRDIVEAVDEADGILPRFQDGEDGAPMGQIYVNLVDLMECVDLKLTDSTSPLSKHEPEDYMGNTENRRALESVFKQIKSKDRIKAILYEECRSRFLQSDHAVIATWLRKHFPSPRYQIMLHAHGGTGMEHAQSLEAVNAGADGVWAGFIPQAAQAGHNSYFLYLHNLMLNGNQKVWEEFDLHVGVEAAKMLYSLNFNSVTYPRDCPIWGWKAPLQDHTAFDVAGEKDWRSRKEDLYHRWSAEDQMALHMMRQELSAIEEKIRRKQEFENYRQYPIAPLVTDAMNIGMRMGELKLINKRNQTSHEAAKEVGDLARQIMIATMNAGVRVNYDDPDMLKKLAGWIDIIKAPNG